MSLSMHGKAWTEAIIDCWWSFWTKMTWFTAKLAFSETIRLSHIPDGDPAKLDCLN